MPDISDISELESRIGYCFMDKQLLLNALTHPSYTKQASDMEHNQRLEFLGDAVLGLVLAEQLFNEFHDQREGVLTRYRSMLIKGEKLCRLAREIKLGKFLRIGDAEDSQGGRNRASILEDAFEAMIGAVYLDGGLAAARTAALHLYGDLEKRIDQSLQRHNPKGKLQELFQPELGNDSITYELVEATGPDHLKEFKVNVWVAGKCLGTGTGNSKKLAEEEAAREALESLQSE